MKRFDTCFFERYARLTLMTLLGDEFAALVNRDRPDLQMEDGSLGIEVTRAMEPRKEVAVDMLKEMAGVEVPESDREEIGQIIKSGYAYGLQEGRYVGHLEQVAEVMARHNYSEELIHKLFWKNFYNFAIRLEFKRNVAI